MVAELGWLVRSATAQPVEEVLLGVVAEIALLFGGAGAAGRGVARPSPTPSKLASLASELLHGRVGRWLHRIGTLLSILTANRVERVGRLALAVQIT